jgi:site-specific DNA-methyltransferase (adenine-specific)
MTILNGTLKDHIDSIPEIDLIYIDPPFATGRNFGEYDDSLSPEETVWNVLDLLSLAWEKLKTGGNVIIHVDWRTAHLYRFFIEEHLDGFTLPNSILQNEIIWKYNSGGASKKHLSRKHDNLLWYTKGDGYTFNVMREPYPHNYGDRPGFHPEGKMLADVWEIPFISTSAKERCGYPTQKPLALLERVIEIFSNENDLVLDFFAGSGTTGVAARKLQRDFILIDVNPEATRITEERIQNLYD